MVFKVQKVGGDERNRTADPLLARQVLSQLSYTPSLTSQNITALKKAPCFSALPSSSLLTP